jgi:hypothetical protein
MTAAGHGAPLPGRHARGLALGLAGRAQLEELTGRVPHQALARLRFGAYKRRMKQLSYTLLAFASIVLVGCGGGGGSASGPAVLAPPAAPVGTITPGDPVAGSADFSVERYTNVVLSGRVAPAVDPLSGDRLGADTSVPLAAQVPEGTTGHIVRGYLSPTDGTGTFVQLDDGTNDNRVTVAVENFAMYVTTVKGGVQVGRAYLGRALPVVHTQVGLSLNQGATLNGKPLVAVAAAGMPALGRIQFGDGATGRTGAAISHYERTIGALTVRAPAAGLFDDFDRPDGAIGAPPTGQIYVQADPWPGGPVLPQNFATILNRRLVTVDNGAAFIASYNGVELQAPPQKFFAAVTFTPGVRGTGNATLVTQSNGLRTVSDILDGSIHIGFLDHAVQVQKFDRRVFTQLQHFNYATPVALDGVTIYNVGWRIVGNKMFLLKPDGTFVEYEDAALVALAGKYAIYESFWRGVTSSHSVFAAVAAQ